MLPILRTVQLIEKLEQIPRGVYSGVIGFFSVAGASDFSVVIRTAGVDKGKVLASQWEQVER